MREAFRLVYRHERIKLHHGIIRSALTAWTISRSFGKLRSSERDAWLAVSRWCDKHERIEP